MDSWTTRRKAAGAGVGVGLLLTALMARLTPDNRVLYGFKRRFREGVTYGIGGAMGVLWCIGLLHRIGDALEERRLREALADPDAAKRKSKTEATAASFGAGVVATVVVSAGAGVLVKRSGESNCDVIRRAGYGVSLGLGFILSATALNWAVEQWDSLNNDEEDEAKNVPNEPGA